MSTPPIRAGRVAVRWMPLTGQDQRRISPDLGPLPGIGQQAVQRLGDHARRRLIARREQAQDDGAELHVVQPGGSVVGCGEDKAGREVLARVTPPLGDKIPAVLDHLAHLAKQLCPLLLGERAAGAEEPEEHLGPAAEHEGVLRRGAHR